MTACLRRSSRVRNRRMGLYIFAFVLLVIGFVGSILSGGIFTIVIVPLGVIALVTAFIATLWIRVQQGRAAGATPWWRNLG